MSLKNYIHPVWYALSDYIAALITWALFYKVRESLLPSEIFTANFSSDNYMLWASIFNQRLVRFFNGQDHQL